MSRRPGKRLWITLATAAAHLAAPFALAYNDPPPPNFRNVTVHDPSVVRIDGRFYIFGSHMAAAQSDDLMSWERIPQPFANPEEELAEALEWSTRPDSAAAHWAPDVAQLDDGRFFFYYCTGNLSGPWGYLGVAISDSIGGPYTNLGLIRRSGEQGFNAAIHPNSVDPHTFFDKEGRLWMVYGSYSGGLFILEMNGQTGFPLRGQEWGTRLAGNNHSRIEAPFILYSPESDYYYLFMSFGGLGSTGGYNMRVARSRNPDGPYFDSAGTDMRTVHGPPGSFFDDAAIEPHGVKLAGNFRFLHFEGEPRTASTGYRSPGHNSAYYDEATGKYYNIFHTRFIGTGQHAEAHQVRVHQLFLNEDEWLVMAPHRYAGESLRTYSQEEIVGQYKFINHGKAVTANVIESQIVRLHSDHTLSGAHSGTWQLKGDHHAELTIEGDLYRGVFVRQWDHDNRVWVTGFTALSANGVSIWGSKVALPESSPAIDAIPEKVLRYGETLDFTIPSDGEGPFGFTLASGPPGMTVHPETGRLLWNPLLTDTGTTPEIMVRVEGNGSFAEGAFTVTVAPVGNASRLDLDFTEAGTGGILDSDGRATGFTERLPGTGSSRPLHDRNLYLDTGNGRLAISSTRSDYNGQAGMDDNGSIGLALDALGFTGSEDFAVSATFRPLPGLQNIDQAGLFVGRNSGALTRAGAIVFNGIPEAYSVHTENGSDRNARFSGTAVNGTNPMNVVISRETGVWRYFVNGIESSPTSAPAHLDGHSDLVAGVFALNTFNDNPKTVELDCFSLVLINGEKALTQIEAWRKVHFGTPNSDGPAADLADFNGNGIPNLLAYAVQADPLSPMASIPIVITGSPEPGRLAIVFNRVADPFLTYTVDAASDLRTGWTSIWSSSGSSNTEGPVSVTDTTDSTTHASRFLRLRVSGNP